MERIEHLVDVFRKDHEEIESTVLLEFAEHVRRVLIDELREDMKAGEVQVHISMQVHGQAFSAKGPRSYVESLLANWQDLADAPPRKNLTPGFNRMKLISGR